MKRGNERRTPAGTRSGRGRRPYAEVRRDVLDAAAELLFDRGIAGFTFEEVSARSGVSRATLYRHWASRGALALDGYFHRVGCEIEIRDTGDVRADLADALRRFLSLVSRPRVLTAFTQLIGAAQADEELAAAFHEHYFGPRRARITHLLAAAVDRGQLRKGTDVPVVIDLLWGAVYQRMLLPNLRGGLAPGLAETVVDTVLDGAAPRGGTSPSAPSRRPDSGTPTA